MIAMVGADDPGTFDDLMRLDQAVELGLPPPRQPADLDIINLKLGRDFLRESKTYDGVVVHSVFHSNRTSAAEFARSAKAVGDAVGQSPVHSLDRWRERLVETRAKVIVVWELLPVTLNGWTLGSLPGYRVAQRDWRVTVYVRTKAKR